MITYMFMVSNLLLLLTVVLRLGTVCDYLQTLVEMRLEKEFDDNFPPCETKDVSTSSFSPELGDEDLQVRSAETP